MKNPNIPLSSGASSKGKYGGAEINGSGINNFDLRGLLRLGGQCGGNPLTKKISLKINLCYPAFQK